MNPAERPGSGIGRSRGFTEMATNNLASNCRQNNRAAADADMSRNDRPGK